MSNSSTPISTQNTDEIDLVELFRAIWDKKWWVVLTTFVTTLLAGVYAFTAKEQWTSKATVIAPQLADLGDYLTLHQEFNLILRRDEVDVNALSESLFNNFNRLAQSQDVKNEFFVNSGVYKQLSKGKNEKEQQQILFELSNEATKFTMPDLKKEPNAIGRTLSFSAETPIEAQDTLSNLIQFVNERAFNTVFEDFVVNFQNVLVLLKYKKSLLQEDLTVNRTVQLENLNKAYETAVKAGIKEYSADTSSIVAVLSDTKISLLDSKLADSSYLFMLGEKYLKAQIDVENEKGIVYPPSYYQIDFQLKQLELLFEKTKEVTAKSYSYQASPDYPIFREGGRIALVIIGTILGIILSSSIILIKDIFTRYR